MNLGSEPTIIIQSVVAVLTMVQFAVVSMPTWLHTILAALVIGLGAIVNRQKVTPVARAAPAPPLPPAR